LLKYTFSQGRHKDKILVVSSTISNTDHQLLQKSTPRKEVEERQEYGGGKEDGNRRREGQRGRKKKRPFADSASPCKGRERQPGEDPILQILRECAP
jgi:hypothetical protein